MLSQLSSSIRNFNVFFYRADHSVNNWAFSSELSSQLANTDEVCSYLSTLQKSQNAKGLQKCSDFTTVLGKQLQAALQSASLCGIFNCIQFKINVFFAQCSAMSKKKSELNKNKNNAKYSSLNLN